MKIIILSLFLLLICLFIWSVIIEPNILTVKHLQIKDEQLKGAKIVFASDFQDRKSTRLNSSHKHRSRMPSSA